MRKILATLMLLIATMGIATAVSEDDACWIPAQIVYHPEVNHTGIIVDTSAWTEHILVTPEVNHTVVVVVHPAVYNTVNHSAVYGDVYHPEVNHTVFHPEINHTVWMKNNNGKSGHQDNEHPCKAADGSNGCHDDGYWFTYNWYYNYWDVWVPVMMSGHNHHDDEKLCTNDKRNNCHADVIVDQEAWTETVMDSAAYTELNVLITPAWDEQVLVSAEVNHTEVVIDTPINYSNVYHPEVNHTGLIVDQEAQTEVIPGYRNPECEIVPTPVPTPVIDTDGDGIPDAMDACPNDKTNTCKNRPFFGYTFGTGDCNRIAILSGQLPNQRAWYMMGVISWDYKNTIPQMYTYCKAIGEDMTPVTEGYRDYKIVD